MEKGNEESRGRSHFNQNPLPSGMPSPELGAAPGPGLSKLPKGESNPLPSETPSPALGAGPIDTAALTTALAQSIAKANIAATAIVIVNFFVFLTTYLN